MKLPDHLKIFISGSFVSIVGNLLLGGANYLTRRTMAVNLSQSDYGCFYGAFALISVILVLLYNGVNDGCTVLISSDPEHRRSIFFRLWKWRAIAGTLCALVLIVLTPWITVHYLHTSTPYLIYFLSFYVLFQSLNGTIISYTTGCKQFKAKSCFQVLEALLLLGLAALFTRLYGMKGGAAAYASAALLTGPLYIWWVCRDTQKEEKKELSKTLPAGWFSLIGMVSAITFFQMLLMHTSSIILMYLRGAESNAVFNIAQPVAQIFLSLMVFHQVFLPISVEMVQKKEFGKLRLYAGFGIIITLAVLPVLYILLSCTSHWIISLLFSKAYADQAETPTIILITGFLFNALGSFITQIMIAMKKMTLLLWGLVLTLLINIGCNFILISRMDVSGASWATLLSYLFFSIFVIAAFYHTLSKEVQGKTS